MPPSPHLNSIMADTTMVDGATVLAHTPIPIAQLNPDLLDPHKRCVKAIVTLTWPYSSATGSVAFLLAEPDFRLRKTRGQVRVQFSGSSAKGIAEEKIASGDEVILCLDEVDFMAVGPSISAPGRGVDCELRFTERLLLQFRPEESHEFKTINIDHPALEPETPAIVRVATPEPESPTVSIYSRSINGAGKTNGDEWASPAFIKRARTSYGSLFANSFDLFEEDGTVPGKGRKRTRLSSTWRYESRSPSPAPEFDQAMEQDFVQSSPEPAKATEPEMTDEGCQTEDFEAPGELVLEQPQQESIEDRVNVVPSTELGNAAEILAQFSQGFVSTDKIIFASASSERNQESAMPPPAIHTTFVLDAPATPGIEVSTSVLNPPTSPRLRSLPSDNLSLVSPFVTSKVGLSTFANDAFIGQPFGSGDHHLSRDDETAAADNKDSYSVSPPSHHTEQAIELVVAASDAVDLMDDNSLGEHNHPEPFQLEDKNGHWQSVDNRIDQSASSHEIQLQEDGFYDEVDEDEAFEQESIPPPFGPETISQYSELDEDKQNQTIRTWGQPFTKVPYPDLSDDEVETSRLVRRSPQALSPSKSRSQSIHSAVIDLTESDDEAETSNQDGEAAEELDNSHFGERSEDDLDQVLDQETDMGKRIIQEYDDEENETLFSRISPEGDADGDVNSPRYLEQTPARGRYVEEGNEEDNEEDESDEDDDVRHDRDDEEFSEEGHFTENTRLPREDFESEVEEELYSEEDEMDDNDEFTPPPGSAAPVFIDLLSSDDDEEKVPVAPRTRSLSASSSREVDNFEHFSDEDGQQEVEYEEGESIDTDDDETDDHAIVPKLSQADASSEDATDFEHFSEEGEGQQVDQEERESSNAYGNQIKYQSESRGSLQESDDEEVEDEVKDNDEAEKLEGPGLEDHSVLEDDFESVNPLADLQEISLPVSQVVTEVPSQEILLQENVDNNSTKSDSYTMPQVVIENPTHADVDATFRAGDVDDQMLLDQEPIVLIEENSYTDRTDLEDEEPNLQAAVVGESIVAEQHPVLADEGFNITKRGLLTAESNHQYMDPATEPVVLIQQNSNPEMVNVSDEHTDSMVDTSKVLQAETEPVVMISVNPNLEKMVTSEDDVSDPPEILAIPETHLEPVVLVDKNADLERMVTPEGEVNDQFKSPASRETHLEPVVLIEEDPVLERMVALEEDFNGHHDPDKDRSESPLESIVVETVPGRSRHNSVSAVVDTGSQELLSSTPQQPSEHSHLQVSLGLDGVFESEQRPLEDQNLDLREAQSLPSLSTISQSENATQESDVKSLGFPNDVAQLPIPAEAQPSQKTHFSKRVLSRISWSFTTGTQSIEDEDQNSAGTSIESATEPYGDMVVESIQSTIQESTTVIQNEEIPIPELVSIVDGDSERLDSATHDEKVALTVRDEDGNESIDALSAAGNEAMEGLSDNESDVAAREEVLNSSKIKRGRKRPRKPKVGEENIVPRRSQRIGRSAGSVTDQTEADRQFTPLSPHKSIEVETIQKETTPRRTRKGGRSAGSVSDIADIDPSPTMLGDRSSPEGHDASIEMALSALDSSPAKTYDLRRPHVVDMKVLLHRSLRTKLSSFTALKMLRYNVLKKLDVLAVALTDSTEPQRAKAGARDYYVAFLITDPTIAPSTVTEIHVYRPHEEALPIVKAGDGVLLRNFLVISVKGSNSDFGLRSEKNEACSWAVFRDGEEEADVRGPPVEYGEGEKIHIQGLKEWHGTLDTMAKSKLNKAIKSKAGVMGMGTT